MDARAKTLVRAVDKLIEDGACAITDYGPGDMSMSQVQDHHAIVALCQQVRSETLKAAAVETVLRGFDLGIFQRNPAGDADPAWAMRVFPYLRALAQAKVVIDAERARQEKL